MSGAREVPSSRARPPHADSVAEAQIRTRIPIGRQEPVHDDGYLHSLYRLTRPPPGSGRPAALRPTGDCFEVSGNVGRASLPIEGRRSADRRAEAETRARSPAATGWRSTFVTRLPAGLDEPRPRPHGPEIAVLCQVADCLDPAARPRASPNVSGAGDVHRAAAHPPPREKAPPEWVSLGLSRRPARPIKTRLRG